MSTDLTRRPGRRTQYPGDDAIVPLLATMTQPELARHFHVTPQTVRRWRHTHGLPSPLRSRSAGNVRYQTDPDFFAEIDTPEKAYILGFIVADGSVHKTGRAVDITVKASDAGILQAIASALGCDAPIRRKVSTGGYGGEDREQARLYLSRRKLVSDLGVLGVHPNKTFTATYPVVDAHLERHLVRGLWDGDGWVGKQQFSLVGTDAVVEGVMEAAERHTGCRLTPRRDRKGFLNALGSALDRPVMRWMYSDTSISLDRKAEVFRLYWS